MAPAVSGMICGFGPCAVRWPSAWKGRTSVPQSAMRGVSHCPVQVILVRRGGKGSQICLRQPGHAPSILVPRRDCPNRLDGGGMFAMTQGYLSEQGTDRGKLGDLTAQASGPVALGEGRGRPGHWGAKIADGWFARRLATLPLGGYQEQPQGAVIGGERLQSCGAILVRHFWRVDRFPQMSPGSACPRQVDTIAGLASELTDRSSPAMVLTPQTCCGPWVRGQPAAARQPCRSPSSPCGRPCARLLGAAVCRCGGSTGAACFCFADSHRAADSHSAPRRYPDATPRHTTLRI